MSPEPGTGVPSLTDGAQAQFGIGGTLQIMPPRRFEHSHLADVARPAVAPPATAPPVLSLRAVRLRPRLLRRSPRFVVTTSYRSFVVLQGWAVVDGYQPDGDSERFVPDELRANRW